MEQGVGDMYRHDAGVAVMRRPGRRHLMDRLAAAAEGMPPGTVLTVTIPADEVREYLEGQERIAGELSTAQLADFFGRKPGTMAAWCRRGLFPGAWQDEDGQWHIPEAAFQAYIRTRQKEAADNAAELQRGEELRRQRRRAGVPERIPNPPRPDLGRWRDKVKRT
jgi:hypothetical protein